MKIGDKVVLGYFYRELTLASDEVVIEPCFTLKECRYTEKVISRSKVKFDIKTIQIVSANPDPIKMVPTIGQVLNQDDSLQAEGFINYFLKEHDGNIIDRITNYEWASITYHSDISYVFNFTVPIWFNVKDVIDVNDLLNNPLSRGELRLLLIDLLGHMSGTVVGTPLSFTGVPIKDQ